MSSDEWLKLPRKVKKKALVDSFQALRERAKFQIRYLRESFKKHEKKDIRHEFMLTMVIDFWEDVDFLFFLGRGKWQKKSIYTLRPVLEKLAKLALLTSKKAEEQKKLARLEALSILKHYYEISNQKDPLRNSAKKQYENLAQSGDPKITDGKRQFQKAGFGTAKNTIINANLDKTGLILNLYEEICNSSHGNFFDSLIKKDDHEIINRAFQFAIHCSVRMLQICEFHIDNKVSFKGTEEAIAKSKTKSLLDN